MQLKKWFGMEGFRYSPWQFAIFRILLGTYLIWHFSLLVPYASELFSNIGLVPDPTLQRTYSIFPNILNLMDSSTGATAFVSVLIVLSFCLLIGYRRRLVSILLWFGWACLFNRNNFISNPGLPMIGWLLLAMAIIPEGEPLSKSKKQDEWAFPNELYWGAWLIVGIGYTISGFHKFESPSWQDGTAIHRLLDNPLARDGMLRELMIATPLFVFKIKNYFSLALEMLFLPLIFFQRTRLVAWVAVIGMHFGILTLVNFTDLTLGVVLFHLFTFDSCWIPAKKSVASPVLFFDGVCGLCNSVVDFIFSEDLRKKFKFSPLQGDLAKSSLPSEYHQNLSTLIVQTENGIVKKSKAVITIGDSLGGGWRIFSTMAKIVPTSIADKIYDVIAKNRYRLFGKKETCRLPTAEEKSRFV